MLRLVGAAFVALASSAPGTVRAHDAGMGLVRYKPDGSLDEGFGHAGVVAERIVQGGLTPEALVIQADGRTVLVGTATDLATAAVGFGLARYNEDGTLDSGFGSAGRVLTRVGAATAEAHAVALEQDGNVVVAGGAFPQAASAVSNFAIARYTRDGSLDPAFGAGGVVLSSIADSGAEARAIALQSDGKIVAAGTAFASGATDDVLAVARYLPTGDLDTSFGSSGIVLTNFDATESSPVRAAALVIQTDGKLVAVGSIGGHQGAFALARYLPSGVLDPAFGASGDGKITTQSQASAQAYAAAVQPDGNIVVAGGLGSATDSVAFTLARYLPTGELDASFGAGGLVTTGFDAGGSGAHGLIVEAEGKIVAVGSGYAPGSSPPPATGALAPVNGGFAVVRYLPNGTPDNSFGRAGVVLTTVGDAGSMPAAVAVQPDGKLVAAGLTYFLVQPATDSQINVFFVVPVAALVIVAAAFVLKLRRSRTGRGPAASRSRR